LRGIFLLVLGGVFFFFVPRWIVGLRMDWLDRAGDYGVAISVKRDKNTQKKWEKGKGKGEKKEETYHFYLGEHECFPGTMTTVSYVEGGKNIKNGKNLIFPQHPTPKLKEIKWKKKRYLSSLN